MNHSPSTVGKANDLSQPLLSPRLAERKLPAVPHRLVTDYNLKKYQHIIRTEKKKKKEKKNWLHISAIAAAEQLFKKRRKEKKKKKKKKPGSNPSHLHGSPSTCPLHNALPLL